MKRWRGLVTAGPLVVAVLWGSLIPTGGVWGAEIRVGLAHKDEVEIRCDGPIGLTVDQNPGSAIELQPGFYTIRVVETPSFFRLDPALTGVLSKTNSAVDQPLTIHSWLVDLVQTKTKRIANQAERDARRRLGGRITTSRLGDGWLVSAGPFPNEYLARQALEKAQRLGFPATIRKLPIEEIWNVADVGGAPRQIRRLVPQGEAGLGKPPKSFRMEEEFASAAPEPQVELEPLPTFPPEELELQPIPTFPPEELMVEPLPEPKPEELGPDLGLIPAPKPESTPAPRKIRKIKPPLPKPPGFARNLPPQRRRIPPAYAPKPLHPLPRKPETPSARPYPKPQPPYPLGRQFAQTPSEPTPTPPPPKISVPPEPVPPPVVGEQPKPEKKPFVFLPKKKKSRFPRSLKSFPIIRRFWWEPPLVEPAPEELEEQLASALKHPAPESEGEVVEPEASISPPPVSVEQPESEISLPEVPPTPIPFNPEEARRRAIISETPPGEFPSELPRPEVAPFPEPESAQLPPEQPTSPETEELESLLPPEPGMEEEEAPLLIEQQPSLVEQKEEPGESKVETPQQPAPPSPPGKRITAPKVGPVRVAYVQVFNESGDPVTDPVTVVDLHPLTGSHLEFNNHSYHGSFQAFAPNEEWLVLVNRVDLEDYLAGAVPREIPTDAPLPVLKAQAVMSRCYALLMIQRGDYADYGYDIPGTPESEWPYSGRELETDKTRQAVLETQGEVLVDSSSGLATPVYCFSSGGYVADAKSIWGGQGTPVPDYLVAHPDYDPARIDFQIGPEGFSEDETLLERWLKASPNTYDKAAAGEHFRWKKNLSSKEMDELVNSYWNDQVGKVKSITITQRAISGHATRMVIRGEKQTVTARDSDTIRAALNLDSSLIVIKKRFGSGWDIFGGGFGHGVGLSQCGAIGLVEQKGANYRQILHFYFEKLRLGKRTLVRTSGGA